MQYVEGLNGETARHSRVSALAAEASWIMRGDRLVPQGETYRHKETGEDNGDAHIKRQLMGREVVVAITEGRLDFGPWEQIFYGEFDGLRRKRMLVKVIGL